jgi:hypothetical protein
MSRPHALYRWFTLAALADWLIARTLMRLAIFMPKGQSPLVIVAYQWLGYIGQFAATLVSVLALCGVGWMAWQLARAQRQVVLPIVLVCLLALSLALLVFTPTGPLLLSYHLLLIAAVLLLGGRPLGHAQGMVWERGAPLGPRLAGTGIALVLLSGEVHQLLPALYETWRWPGPAPFASAFFNLGELALTLSSIAVWWAYGRGASRRVWLVAALPAVAFIAFRYANPAMTGILAIWSMGLTLYLPWPVYVLSLWLTGVTVMQAFQRSHPTGWAILLLMAGGYAPQLSTHAFINLLALWILTEAVPSPIPAPAATDIPLLQPQRIKSA